MSEPYELRIACWPNGTGGAKVVETLDATDGSRACWIHVRAHQRDGTASFLREQLGFHELEVEDALTEGERPHLHETETHLFFTAPSVRSEAGKLYFSEVAFHLSKGRLITVATEPVALLDAYFERCQKASFGTVKEPSRLLHELLDGLVDAYYPVMDSLEDQSEALEDLVFKGQPVGVKDLLRLKRRLLETRRRLTPLRDILNGLLRHDVPLIAKADRVYFHDVYDHVLRVLEHADLNRDILASVLDANLATVSNRLNEVMRVLTVASVILMSAALIAGVYGMNFRHMPETEWPWGYPLAVASMVTVGLFELWIFKRKGFLK